MAQRFNQDARLRSSRHNRRTPAAIFEQALAVKERDVAIFQLFIVAAEAAFDKDGRSPRGKVGPIGREPKTAERREATESGQPIHFVFMPTPN